MENNEEIDDLIKAKLWEPLPPLNQITTDTGRWYSPPDAPEDRYFSVTTIIDSDKNVSSRQALEAWKRSQVLEGKDPKQPSIDGDKMHNLIENYIRQGFKLPKASDSSGRAYKLFKQYEQGFLKTHSIVPHLIEGRLFTEVNSMKYAGTVDLVASIQVTPEGKTELALIDHKSISKIANASSKRKGYIPQLSAYAKAIKDKYGLTIDVAYLNFASVDGFKSYRIELAEILENWDVFHSKLVRFYGKGEFPVE